MHKAQLKLVHVQNESYQPEVTASGAGQLATLDLSQQHLRLLAGKAQLAQGPPSHRHQALAQAA